MADNEISITVSNRSQNIDINTGGGNTQIGVSGDNSQYFSNEARKSAERAAQSATEAEQSATNAQTVYEDLQEFAGQTLENIETETDGSISEITTAKENAIAEINATGIDGRANIDLSNISTIGQAKFDEKANKTDLDTKANKDFSNVVEIAEGSLVDNELKNKLNKQQITNCLLEVPQRIKYTLEDGTLTIKAGSVVIVPYGTTNKTSEFPVGSQFLNSNWKVVDTQFANGKFFVWAELQNDKISDTSGASAEQMQNIAVNITGNLITWGVNSESGTGTATKTYCFYYNTTTNLVGKSSNSTTLDYSNALSLPIAKAVNLVNYTGWKSIDQIFNGYGYIGRHAWFDKGIKCLFGIKRNPDGTIENKELITNFYVWETHNWTEGRLALINEYGTHTDIMPSRILKGLKSEMPSEVSMNSFHLYICTDTLEVFYTSTKVANWQPQSRVVPIFEYGAVNPNDGNILTYFKPYQTFRAVDYNEIRSIPHVVNRYVNGASWYRVWSDGWIEQGGVTTDTSGNITYNLLKSYSNTNYTLTFGSVGSGSSGGGGAFPAISAKTASSFSIHYDYYTTNKNKGINWHACGY